MRYWMYKCNTHGGPAGYWGDWHSMVFSQTGSVEWGGHSSTRSPAVARCLDEEVSVGDVVVAYQTDLKAVVGFCQISRISGQPGDLKLRLQPIEELATPFHMHEHKAGTLLEDAKAVRSPVMLRELYPDEMKVLLTLAGAPKRILQGKAAPSGWKPRP